MTIEEAISYITHHAFIADDVKDMAIAALEKQIPKKPIENPTDDTCLYYENYCPSCENLLVVRYKHCPKCGQRIDWSVEE